MKWLVLFCIVLASCDTVRVTEMVNASRESTREAFGEYVISKGGTLVESTDMTARGEVPAYKTEAARVASTILAGASIRTFYLANFAGNHPCTLVLIPEMTTRGLLVRSRHRIGASEKSVEQAQLVAREIKRLAESKR